MPIPLSDDDRKTAVADAQTFLRDSLCDVEATCCEPGFASWPDASTPRRTRGD